MNTDELRVLLNKLDSLNSTLKENIWGYADFPGRTDEPIYIGREIALDQDFIDNYIDVINNLADELSSILEQLEDNDDETITDSVESLHTQLNQFEFSESIIELINFDSTEYALNKMDKNSLEINEDTLDEYAQNYGQEAFEIKDELATNAREDFLALDSAMKQLISGLENTLNNLAAINK